MHSMTAALAAGTKAPPDPATQEQGGRVTELLGQAWNWSAGHLPGGNLTVIGAVIVLAMLADGHKKSGAAKTDWKKADQAVAGIFRKLYGTVRGLVLAVWAVLRFYGGRELRGEPRSDATFLRSGKLTSAGAPQVEAVAMESIALAPPRVSLVKPQRRQPRPWALATAAWIETYSGKGARALDRAVRALDRAVRAALWAVRAAVRVWRFLVAVWGVLRAVYGFLAPIVTTIARMVRLWHTWPYAARGLARVAMTAALLGLLVPAWRTMTVVLLVLALGAVAAAAHRFQPKPPGDNAVYGPKIWPILSHDLGLPEDEPWENWLHLPERLADADARMVVRLPWDFRGSEGEREALTALLNSRVPGEWVGRFRFTGEHATAVYTHKPPPKPPAPTPEPPGAVDIWDPKVQEILAALGPDEFYCGQDTFNQPIIQKMSDEQAHWALSVGSGGGKSAFLQWLAVQMLMKRGTIIGIDPKMVSLTPLIGIHGVHLYGNPQAPQDMRATLEWVVQVVNARNYEKKHKTRTEFLPLYVFLEECNQLADILKEEYTATKESGAPAGDPIWRDAVASTLRLGREVNVHIIAVFQDFKDTQFGGVSLVPLFPFKILGSYREQQWKRIMGASFPMPPIQKKAGRMVLVTDTGDVTRIQTPYAPWDPELTKDENQQEAYRLLTAYYKELRAEHGYSTEGLYVAPPAHSPEVAPALIRAVSRDSAPEGPNGGSEGGLSDETAGRGVTPEGSVTPGVTGQRDRLRLIPGQGGAKAAGSPLEAPTLLTIAEIAREMQARGYDIEAGLIRQHKRRRESTGFPVGIENDGAEKFTLTQLLAFYEQRGIEKREESKVGAEQGDAV
ncbi:hypothetical protein OHB41_51825 [Streptomyces sp. NBC_01571]|uniref:hypothetical protein n=1 Tax=Streptomyces sp. NBC_01571 TaxID=2975883 RepID=UPI002252A6D4|nr:hypothetical protein [Streptomyces sp. NBC_01571]MCX4581450.1 hypothetical protein [Streptomyces sp. NBC_01571]